MTMIVMILIVRLNIVITISLYEDEERSIVLKAKNYVSVLKLRPVRQAE